MAIFKALLVLSVAALAAAAPTAHVIFIIGQSNSIGYNSEGRTGEDVAYDNIVQSTCCVNGALDFNQCRLIAGQDPLHHQCDDWYINGVGVGFGMTFARNLRNEIPADDVIVLVPSGIGGTGFADNVWPAYTGTGFNAALNKIRATFNLIAYTYPGHTAVLDAILWHQGELDADINTSTDVYLSNDIIPMINAWRDSSLIPQSNANVPFIVGNLLPSWVLDPSQTQRLGVYAALQSLPQYVARSAYTSSDGLTGDPSEGQAPIHFSAPSQRIFGGRYFQAYKSAKTNIKV